MKKVLLALSFCSLWAVQSCKKDDPVNPVTPVSLSGNWTLNSYAFDDNNDGIIASSEKYALDTGDYGYLFVDESYIKDSTSLTGFSITYPYTLRNDTVFLQGFAGSDPIFVINKLDATNLDIYIPEDSAVTEWRYYTR